MTELQQEVLRSLFASWLGAAYSLMMERSGSFMDDSCELLAQAIDYAEQLDIPLDTVRTLADELGFLDFASWPRP